MFPSKQVMSKNLRFLNRRRREETEFNASKLISPPFSVIVTYNKSIWNYTEINKDQGFFKIKKFTVDETILNLRDYLVGFNS